MSRQIITLILSVALTLITLPALHAYAASTAPAAEASDVVPLDSKQANKLLEEMRDLREVYNAMNDSIYFDNEMEEWLKVYERRAQVQAETYKRNSEIIKQIKAGMAYERQRSMHTYSDTFKVAPKNYKIADNLNLHMLRKLNKFINTEKTNFIDPFLLQDLLKETFQTVDSLMPNSEYGIICNYLRMRIYYETGLMDDSGKLLSVSLKYANRVLAREDEFDQFSYNSLRLDILGTYSRILSNAFFASHEILTIDQARALWQRAVRLSERHKDYLLGEKNNPEVVAFNYAVSSFERRLVRNYYLSNHFDLHTAYTDSMVQQQILAYEDHFNYLTAAGFHNYAMFKCYMGQWTPSLACRKCDDYYSKHPLSVQITDIQSASKFLNAYTTRIFLTDINPLYSEEVKHQKMKAYSEEIVDIFKHCTHSGADNKEIGYAVGFMTQRRLLKHLSSTDVQNFAMQMMVAMQVDTYAHSKMVAKLCDIVLSGIIKYNPKLMLTTPGLKKLRQVEEHAKALKNYLYRSSMVHDLGKNTIVTVVENNYRPITDFEYNFLKRHPENGLPFLRTDSVNLWIYSGPMLGHHKWYDGTHGYPENFDNVHSPARTFTDILTICDCLEAATEHLGRNYAKKKSFAQLMQEFQAEAGTRYNPDIVQFIMDNAEVYQAMQQAIEVDWKENYYDIFKLHFRRAGVSAPSTSSTDLSDSQ